MPVVVKVCFDSLVYFCSMGIKPGSLESVYFLCQCNPMMIILHFCITSLR